MDFNRNKPPAITVLAWRKQKEAGWKEKYNLTENCDVSQDFKDIIECIDNKTFNLSEILEQATSGDEGKTDITNTSFWRDDLSSFKEGISYSLNQYYYKGKDSTKFALSFTNSQKKVGGRVGCGGWCVDLFQCSALASTKLNNSINISWGT